MAKAEIVNVNLGDRSYAIHIAPNLLDVCGELIINAASSSKYIIVTDKNIPSSYSDRVEKSLGKSGAKEVHKIVIPAGEASKSFSGLENLLDKIFELKPDRKTVLIALGGGVVGDLTGFAASILLRGVRFVQIPTTVLSQVDSSVGGKTGINNKFGKNLVGSFYQPALVLADLNVLESLPDREFLAGYAEVVKYALINDKDFFQWLEDNLDKVIAKDEDALKYIIAKSCKAKADIVAKDEKEGGARALLNLGHTFGHALEQQMGYGGSLVHGEAVAIGMVFAFFLSNNLGLCAGSDVKKVKSHLKKAGLPTSPLQIKNNWSADALMSIMRQDKKVDDGKMVFILANAIGESFIKKDIAEKDIFATIEQTIS